MIDCLRKYYCGILPKRNVLGSEISQVLRDANFVNTYPNLVTVPKSSSVWANLHQKKYNEWQNNIYQLSKLRAYVLCIGNFCVDPYIYHISPGYRPGG